MPEHHLIPLHKAYVSTSQIEIQLIETSVFEPPQRAQVALDRMHDANPYRAVPEIRYNGKWHRRHVSA